ncbi:SurA N-terminal domain-containing protein [Xanthobacter sp. TB0139]|uniref:SurA N-terminal domain-containing protein n=1 Tax=Xanthobacter sp. TB0139 TaxID=3459178 RepID=UPI00403A3EB7
MFIKRHCLGFLAALFLAVMGPAVAAHAQQVVVIVNGDPITTYDVSQRQRLSQMLDRKSLSQKQALEEVINERLKLQQARNLNEGIDQEDLDKMFENVASRSGRTADQLAAMLKQSGLDPRLFKNKLAADYVWNQYVRARVGNVTIRDADVAAALQKRGQTENTATEYILRPIILIGKGRMGDARRLRSRFKSCEAGIPMAMAMKEVVVRPQALRLSSDMPKELQKILDKTPEGGLTPPETTQIGVETFAICEKRQIRGESSAKREVKDELSEAQFKKASDNLLSGLRKSALIQYR